MPQEFYVLKCFSCETFQVHIVKKVKKWECKMCGAKQSLKRNYGKGSSKDCRNQVMKLNELRLLKSTNLDQTEDETFHENSIDNLTEQNVDKSKEYKPSVSKWAEYVENIPDTESKNDDKEDVMVVDVKKKRVKKMPGSCSKNKKICQESSEIFSKDCDEVKELFSEQKTEKIITYETEDFIQIENKSNLGKYAKYLQHNDENDSVKVNKTSNIFESSEIDLDEILNF